MESSGRYPKKVKWRNTLAFFSAVIGLATLGIFLSGFTGFLVSTESFYTSSGFGASQSGDFVWSPEQQGLLTSVKLTGYIEGGGPVRVFLRSGEETFLVLDSSILPGTKVTAVNESSQGNESTNESFVQNQSVENETAAQNETAPLSGNLTANETGIGGITASIISEENVSQNLTQEIPANESQENAAGNVTVPPEYTGNASENLAEPQESATGNITVSPEPLENLTIQNETAPVFRFEDICVESCSLPELNESSYTFVFEIENGTILHIESVRYSILRYENPVNLPPAGQIPDQTVEAGQTLAINLSLYFSDPEGDTLSFGADSPVNNSIDMNTLSLAPSHEGNFTVTVSASDGTSVAFSSFLLFVLPSNIAEINVTNETEAPSIAFCSGCPDCSEKIRSSPPGSAILIDSDISGSGNCIQLSGAFNLTLNCQGHRITGDGSGCGIFLSDSRENLLKNCIIEGFYVGVYLDRLSSGNVLVSLGVSGNNYGVSLFSSSSNGLEAIEGRIRVSSSSRNAIKCA